MTLEDRAIWWLALDRITVRWEPREYATFADVALLVMSGAQDARDAYLMSQFENDKSYGEPIRGEQAYHNIPLTVDLDGSFRTLE